MENKSEEQNFERELDQQLMSKGIKINTIRKVNLKGYLEGLLKGSCTALTISLSAFGALTGASLTYDGSFESVIYGSLLGAVGGPLLLFYKPLGDIPIRANESRMKRKKELLLNKYGGN